MYNNVRLGYACVNQTWTNRPKKLGGRVTTSRTLRKDSWHSTFDLHKIGELAVQNAKDLLIYLKWNEEHGIRLFRVGSELVPWHDHFELHDLPQYDLLSMHLKLAGDYAKAYGHRLTTHPGPFHILGAHDDEIVRRSIIGLERHSELFDLMGFEPSYENKINIHIGASYKDPETTAYRWLKNYDRLSDNCKARLVVENDDKDSLYSVQMLHDLIYRNVQVPITFDYFHHKFHTSGLSEQEALELAGTTWPSNVRQCCHYSESRRQEYQLMFDTMCRNNNKTIEELVTFPTFAKMKKDFDKIKEQAHSDYIIQPIQTYGHNLDIMVEAKAKELALLNYQYMPELNIYTKEKELL